MARKKPVKRRKKSDTPSDNGSTQQKAIPVQLVPSSPLPPDVSQAFENDGLSLHQKQFLSAFALCSNVSHAAAAVGIKREAHYAWMHGRNGNPEAYKTAYQQAKRIALDSLVNAAHKRAVQGSDALLIFLLKGAFPKKYRDNVSMRHGGDANAPPIKTEHAVDFSKLTLAEVEQLCAIRDRIAGDCPPDEPGGTETSP